ncbi:MAG: HD domain-containing protein [Lentisphaeria bacterium]|nr:HD domain-containing protein [Lentisphaeria bacterium]
MTSERLSKQLEFIVELDLLKGVGRQSYVLGGARKENTAEHSWHVAVMALLLVEYARERVDPCRVVKMLLLHDVVEIDAGDTFLYDKAGNASKAAREGEAADRIFGLLPDDSAVELRALWEDFEAAETADARFAAAIDRFLPLFHNCLSNGMSWAEHGIRRAQVEQHIRPAIERGAKGLWERAEVMLDEAVAKGILKP